MYSAWLSTKDNYPKGKCVYDNSIAEPAMTLIDPELTLTAGAAGEFVFSIAPTQLYYDSFQKLTSIITIMRDDKIIWEGRIINEEMDFYKMKKFTCEGAMAYFNDTIQERATIGYTLKPFIEWIINYHNTQLGINTENAELHKIFKVGYVSNIVLGINEEAFATDYENTLEVLNSIVDRFGGYFVITWDAVGEKVLNYYSKEDSIGNGSLFKTSRQTIEFGHNLLDYTHSYDVTEMCTVVCPMGGNVKVKDPDTDEEKDVKLDLSMLGNYEGELEGHIKGTPYIMSKEAVAANGWIVKKVDFDDCTDLQALYYLGKAYLEEGQFANMTIEVSAFDLGLLSKKVDGLPYEQNQNGGV